MTSRNPIVSKALNAAASAKWRVTFYGDGYISDGDTMEVVAPSETAAREKAARAKFSEAKSVMGADWSGYPQVKKVDRVANAATNSKFNDGDWVKVVSGEYKGKRGTILDRNDMGGGVPAYRVAFRTADGKPDGIGFYVAERELVKASNAVGDEAAYEEAHKAFDDCEKKIAAVKREVEDVKRRLKAKKNHRFSGDFDRMIQYLGYALGQG